MKKITTYLIAIAAFMLTSAVSMAQGGLTPLVGSSHNYTVAAADDVNNTLGWTITTGPVGGYTINSGANQTITLTVGGTATVTVSAAIATQTLTLISVTDGTCSQTLTENSTVTVNPLPATGEIIPD